MSTILSAILPVFIVIGIGIVTKFVLSAKRSRWKKFTDRFGFHDDRWSEVLNKLALYISLPALILYSLIHTDKNELLSPYIISTNIILLAIFILLLLFFTKIGKLPCKLRNTYIMCGFFGNVAYIGFPFILSLFPGSAGDVSIIIAIHVIVAFTLGIAILEYSCRRKKEVHLLKPILQNPLVIAIALGVVALITGIQLPPALDQALNMLAGSASPVVLIAIGLFLARKIRVDSAFWHGLTIGGIKIIVLPLFFLLGGTLLGFGSAFDISILEAGMPIALTNFALAEIYPLDKKVVAYGIIISTVLSTLTLALLTGFVV